MKHNLSGHLAELAARWYFRLHGWQILAHNYITGRGTTAGEIDFIAVRGNTLAFVEVKQRKDITSAAYAISPAQQKRIRTAAANFLAKHQIYQHYDIRFDAVLFAFPFRLRHIPNAF